MITRGQWNARSPKNALSYLASTRGVKIHYTGGQVNPATLTNHSKCIEAVRGIQLGHINGNGWSDIGYSMIACPHDFFVGRGPHKLPAANGPGLNSQHYAVLVLVGSSGVTKPTADHRRQAWRAIDYLRKEGNAGREIKGHRDGYSTSCPGDALYALVRDGFPRPDSSPPAPVPVPDEPSQGEAVPDYLSYGSSDKNPVDVPTGSEWVKVSWDTEYADAPGEHSGIGYTMMKGDPSVYSGSWFVKLSGLPEGTAVELRVSEFVYNTTTKTDDFKEGGWSTTSCLDDSMTAAHHDHGSVSENRKLVLEVRHNAAVDGKVIGARGKLTAWQ